MIKLNNEIYFWVKEPDWCTLCKHNKTCSLIDNGVEDKNKDCLIEFNTSCRHCDLRQQCKDSEYCIKREEIGLSIDGWYKLAFTK